MCAYIEKLFLLVQPDQLLFIAIDGVAPRAKMNQQRQRRYRKVLASEAAAKKRQDAGQPPSPVNENAFDSNCISPGTEFMQRYDENGFALDFFYFEHTPTMHIELLKSFNTLSNKRSEMMLLGKESTLSFLALRYNEKEHFILFI